MAAEVVGGALLSASLQVLFEKMASPDLVNYLSGKKSFGLDVLLRKLKIKLSSVTAVLDDAEYKQIRNQGVKNWLDELQDAVFDAEDLLAEIEADAFWLKMEPPKSSTGLSKVRNFFSSVSDSTDRKREAKIEEILERLEDITREKDILGLKELVVRKNSSWRLPSTSLVEESGVYGRDDDKDVIIKLLLSNDEGSGKMGVIPIVGMGGQGKTTLAQLVYNDDDVKKHFEFRAWVCVSEEFDVRKVTKTVLQSISSTACNDVADLNSLQVKLKERLMGRKFLIVLDDVWNQSYVDLEALAMPFKDGAHGSKIVVTTRSEIVASVMGTVSSHPLKELSKEACWELFAKHASGNGDFTARPELDKIGREIVKKCKGLPLSLKTLGGLLRSTLDVGEWEKVLKSDIWDPTDEQSKILPALRLSYHYLPPHLKRCFAYCSIFPKDYEFEKEDLILLWMAENLLEQPKRSRRMEEVGADYFNDLVSRSFFHPQPNGHTFIMHDLIVDLAKSVSAKYCLLLDHKSANENEMTMQIRHLQYTIRGHSPIKLADFISEATPLRTIIILPRFSSISLTKEVGDLIFKLRCLRALSLYGCYIKKELPDSIGKLRHLRYLNLSGSSIQRLPESLSKLYNLQTLKLARCHRLSKLPKDFHRLINLRYLDVSDSGLKEMPTQMGKLKSLQKLSTFIVGKDDRIKIGELGGLSDLKGKLHIRHLQNVEKAKDVLEARLSDKHLEELKLEWAHNYETADDTEHERVVLDNLLPNKTLKKLEIINYGGTKFPNWLGDESFYKIVEVSLSDCKYCYILPPLGQLPSLKTLTISGFDAVVRVGPEFFGNSSSSVTSFASLENLEFRWMPNWEKWLMPDEAFPKLSTLSVSSCEKLTGDLSCLLPHLTEIKIEACPQLAFPRPMTPIVSKDSYVLGPVFKKGGPGPKDGTQYDAPFTEGDCRDVDDDNCEEGPSAKVTLQDILPPNEDHVDGSSYVVESIDDFISHESCVSDMIPPSFEVTLPVSDKSVPAEKVQSSNDDDTLARLDYSVEESPFEGTLPVPVKRVPAEKVQSSNDDDTLARLDYSVEESPFEGTLPVSVKRVPAEKVQNSNYDDALAWFDYSVEEGPFEVDGNDINKSLVVGPSSIPGSAFHDESFFHNDHQVPMSDLERTHLLLPTFIQELISAGKLLEICFPCTRMPDWCTNWSSRSSVSIKLSPEDNFSSKKGIAMCVVFAVKEHEDFDEAWQQRNFFCHFTVDNTRLGDPIIFQSFERFEAGSFGLCCYVPEQWFAGWLNRESSVIEASVATDRPRVELKMCGMRLIFEQDVENFSKKLAETAKEHWDVDLIFSQHCKQLLDGRTKLKSFGDMVSIRDIPSEELTTSTLSSQHADEKQSDSTSQMKRDIQSLLSKLFEGQCARNNCFYFIIPLRFFSFWFFHHSMGDIAICYLPPNVYNDERWVGLELYVLLKRRPTVLQNNPNSDQIHSLLLVDLYAHGVSTLPILTYPLLIDDSFFGSHYVFFHVPRQCFPEEFSQCRGISIFFRPSTRDLEVEMCGTRLLYEQNSESLIQSMIESTLGREDVVQLLHGQVQMYLKAETSKRDEVEQELPHFGLFSSFESDKIESMQKLLTSTDEAAEEVHSLLQNYRLCLAHNQAYKEFDPVLLHTKHWFSDNQKLIQDSVGEGTSRDLTSSFNHLHMVTETLIAEGHDLFNWKEHLEILLKEFFNSCALATISFKGQIVSSLKHFDPCSTYNFCFPRNEILEWFKHQNSMSTVGIELASDLDNNRNWRGLVICTSFVANTEHHQRPIASSDMPFKILCHLKTSRYCLNPVSMFSITKEKIRWLDHGFIWLTYIPRSLLEELHQQSYVVARIYSEYPGLTVKTCGMRLLYQQDVDTLEQNIMQCWTSFFDNLDFIQQLVPDEKYEKLSEAHNG